MLGKVITEHGQVVNNQDIMVVHLHLKKEKQFHLITTLEGKYSSQLLKVK